MEQQAQDTQTDSSIPAYNAILAKSRERHKKGKPFPHVLSRFFSSFPAFLDKQDLHLKE